MFNDLGNWWRFSRFSWMSFVLQYDVHPFIGLSFWTNAFIICVMGGLGNMVGGFIAAFVFAELITIHLLICF